ncbi:MULTISPECIES: DNA helicase RecQ [unclassified Thioalkalivibrio]|uniref:DNA helicase RecQ n=1 Tax=unclassified Thioalkalivibrio TaxID=2621013 RepID=UPI00036860E3|nr:MULTISPECIES: DNA helicase RecQ [unclassified Thioalkalivibrio]
MEPSGLAAGEAQGSAPAAAPLEILRETFGYTEFRGQQQAIVEHVTAGGDAVVLMPTGGGKSLCYQIPALARPGCGIVISPLIALMQDQVAALRQNGVAAASLDSGQKADEARSVLAALHAGELDLLYMSPERLFAAGMLERLEGIELALFAIDEAHCVSQWGHDFRPEYSQLAVLAERFPQVPRLALTATADGPTRQEIRERLRLEQARAFVSSFDRPNIRYRIAQADGGRGGSARDRLLRFIREEHAGEAGIVYCLSRKKVEAVAEWLAEQGITALPYHAGLPAATRAENQTRFLREEGVVMAATIAFGMGIDKPNVRFVAHLNLPKSLEGYYQETGRAGRDGLPANAWMVYGLQDVVTLRQMLEGSQAGAERQRIEQQKLEAMLGFCEITSCRRQALLAYFDERMPEPCGTCDNCMQPPATWDASVPVQKLLSCIYRTGERFGAGHVIDVLRGSASERLSRLGHDRLSTFGIGKELDKAQWRGVVRQLLARGLLRLDEEGYGGLKLDPACRPVLRGEESIHLREELARPEREARTARPARRDTARSVAAMDSEDRALWEALRALRTDLARDQGVPPYVIFSDATLLEMVAAAPRSRDEMAGISGVGQHKLERYGDAFIKAIEGHFGL